MLVSNTTLVRLSRAPLALAVLAVWSASEPVLYTSAVIDGDQCSLAPLLVRHALISWDPASPNDERHGHEPVGHEPVDEPVADAAA